MKAFLYSIGVVLEPWPRIFLTDLGRYLAAALIVTLAIGLASIRVRTQRAVRSRKPERSQKRRELGTSLLAAAVFGTVGLFVYHGSRSGIFHIYGSVSEHGLAYAVLSLLLIIVAHDAYFYWTHRLLHRRSFFRWTHATHHRSVAPTQWAAYSFAPTEAFVQASFVPLYLSLMPTHGMVLLLWGVHQVIRNAFGHSGVEFEPRSWLEGFWGKHLTTTLHHDLHHAQGRHNFGLYFTWWDRWCGTEHPEYRIRLQELIERLRAFGNGEEVEAGSSDSIA